MLAAFSYSGVELVGLVSRETKSKRPDRPVQETRESPQTRQPGETAGNKSSSASSTADGQASDTQQTDSGGQISPDHEPTGAPSSSKYRASMPLQDLNVEHSHDLPAREISVPPGSSSNTADEHVHGADHTLDSGFQFGFAEQESSDHRHQEGSSSHTNTAGIPAQDLNADSPSGLSARPISAMAVNQSDTVNEQSNGTHQSQPDRRALSNHKQPGNPSSHGTDIVLSNAERRHALLSELNKLPREELEQIIIGVEEEKDQKWTNAIFITNFKRLIWQTILVRFTDSVPILC